jgi:AcrR family transcriptional regulator
VGARVQRVELLVGDILRDEMSVEETAGRRRGRRPGQSGSREAILAAARDAFARDAYAGASLRAIAREAGVDVALIGHFFGSKAGLFVAAVDWPFDPQAAVATMLAGPRREVGRRIAGVFFGHWHVPDKRGPILALFQAAITDATAGALLSEFFTDEIFTPLLTELKVDRVPLRAGLISSQLQGLVFSRYVLHLMPVEDIDDATVIAAVAPTLQRYATGRL